MLRQTHPKLSRLQWTALISNVAASGERTLAAKLAQHARAVCSRLGNVRAFPQVVVSCALPRSLLRQMQRLLTETISYIPGFAKTSQFAFCFLRVEFTGNAGQCAMDWWCRQSQNFPVASVAGVVFTQRRRSTAMFAREDGATSHNAGWTGTAPLDWRSANVVSPTSTTKCCQRLGTTLCKG